MGTVKNDIRFRVATTTDLPTIIAMLTEDPVAQGREECGESEDDAYRRAFSRIQDDPNNEIIVGTIADRIVGFLQVTFMPSLTYCGSWRAHVEGVRVARSMRNRGVGTALFGYVRRIAEARGCRLLQLTTDKRRDDAVKFYRSLGFVETHRGMKLWLNDVQ